MPIEQLADMNALQLSNRLALAKALLQTLPVAEAVAQIESQHRPGQPSCGRPTWPPS